MTNIISQFIHNSNLNFNEYDLKIKFIEDESNIKSLKYIYKQYNLKPRFYGLTELLRLMTIDRYKLNDTDNKINEDYKYGFYTLGLDSIKLTSKNFTINKFYEIVGELFKGNKCIIQTIDFRDNIELIVLLDLWIMLNSYYYKIDYILKNDNTNIEKSYNDLTEKDINEIKINENNNWKFNKFILKEKIFN